MATGQVRTPAVDTRAGRFALTGGSAEPSRLSSRFGHVRQARSLAPEPTVPTVESSRWARDASAYSDRCGTALRSTGPGHKRTATTGCSGRPEVYVSLGFTDERRRC